MSKSPAVCGTESGYARHKRNNETACADCLTAKRVAGRRRYLISRARKSLTTGVTIPAVNLARIYLRAPSSRSVVCRRRTSRPGWVCRTVR